MTTYSSKIIIFTCNFADLIHMTYSARRKKLKINSFRKRITFKYDFADLNAWKRSEVWTFSLSSAIKYGTCPELDNQSKSTEVFHLVNFIFHNQS